MIGAFRTPVFWVIAPGSLAVALLSYRFLVLGFEDAFGGGELIPALLANERVWFIAHVVAAPVALALGAFQFLRRVRARLPMVHRWSGRVYGLAILIGGVAGLMMAINTFTDRPLTSTGFGLLALAWLATTAQGVRTAWNRDFSAHRVWMIYSFALTFSAVTLRVHLGIAGAFGYGYDAVAVMLAWSCWLPNVLVAWLYLRSTPTSSPAGFTAKHA